GGLARAARAARTGRLSRERAMAQGRGRALLRDLARSHPRGRPPLRGVARSALRAPELHSSSDLGAGAGGLPRARAELEPRAAKHLDREDPQESSMRGGATAGRAPSGAHGCARGAARGGLGPCAREPARWAKDARACRSAARVPFLLRILA